MVGAVVESEGLEGFERPALLPDKPREDRARVETAFVKLERLMSSSSSISMMTNSSGSEEELS